MKDYSRITKLSFKLYHSINVDYMSCNKIIGYHFCIENLLTMKYED